MKPRISSVLLAFLGYGLLPGVIGQHSNTIEATLDSLNHTIEIRQRFIYQNNSESSHTTLYFNDWNHAYSSKKTALAKRFGDEFNRSLHLAKDKHRGFTRITSIVDDNYNGLQWSRTSDRDILKVELNSPLGPNEEIELFFTYFVDLPSSRFTNYGHGYLDGYFLRDWYLTPALFDGEWKLYPNKDLNDLATEVANTEIRFKYPNGFYVASNFEITNKTNFSAGNYAQFIGKQRKGCDIILTPENRFTTHSIGSLKLSIDIKTAKFSELGKEISIERIASFIQGNLGKYPHDHLLVAEVDYARNPFYGPNLLPNFIRPYSEQFQFEMKLLKTALNSVVKESLYFDQRKERWVNDAIVNYLMIKYVEQFYPEKKFTGKLANTWGFRSYNLAKMDFNEQYYLLQMASVRRNDHQSLSTSNDSLTRWNQKIANRYKAGLGMAYLGEYLGYKVIDESIHDFYSAYKLTPKLRAKTFELFLKDNAPKDIDWFFKEFVEQRDNIDFKIGKVRKSGDSISLTIKNRTGSKVPISLFGLKKDSVISKYWFTDIDTSRTLSIPNNDETRLVLNYDKKIPEVNQRDNWKSLNGFFSGNKKFQLRFFKDIENPYYNQLFWVPEFKYNVNNGLTAGITVNNRTFINRKFIFSIKPQYSAKEEALVGSASFLKRQFFNEGKLNSINYSLVYGTSFFDVGSRFSTITPELSFIWRPKDFISNRRQILSFRMRNVFRNIDESIIDEIDTDPDFSVFNVRYGDVDNNILKFKSWIVDAQVAGNFSKVSFEWEQRTLYFTNRQLNLRFYAGKFITNNTDSDFFSFALDRPTDYLFDLNYLNRSQNATGITSQQFILAEGGFKSIFDDRFGSDWIVTSNLSFNLWQWIEVYGDVGAIKNKGEDARFVYDSGIRLNLVTDFFELYFPVYSNNGYEIAQPNYGERIRYVITLSPRTLTRLFTRKWF
ncbi:MAG: metalloprotease [Bacteroidota bacterium]